MNRCVAIVCLVAMALAGCSNAADNGPADAEIGALLAAAMADVLYRDDRDPGRIFVLDQQVDISARFTGPMLEEIRSAIERDRPITFVSSRDEALEPGAEFPRISVIDAGVLVSVQSLRTSRDEAVVTLGLFWNPLGGEGHTVFLERVGDRWEVITSRQDFIS